MPRSLAVLVLLAASAEAFLFGNSCGCAQPACAPPPPPPVCAPAPAPVCPPPPACGAAPAYPVAPAAAGYAVAPRVKRDNEQTFDPKCNSEVLKNIITKNIHENTAMAKRQIQTAAANELGGRIDVICSKGTFSYIVNTELYCETAVDGTTCFAFRQSS